MLRNPQVNWATYSGLFLATVLIGACDADSAAKSSTCAQGAERCACYPNSSCNAGLLCLSNVCVALDSGTAGNWSLPSFGGAPPVLAPSAGDSGANLDPSKLGAGGATTPGATVVVGPSSTPTVGNGGAESTAASGVLVIGNSGSGAVALGGAPQASNGGAVAVGGSVSVSSANPAGSNAATGGAKASTATPVVGIGGTVASSVATLVARGGTGAGGSSPTTAVTSSGGTNAGGSQSATAGAPTVAGTNLIKDGSFQSFDTYWNAILQEGDTGTYTRPPSASAVCVTNTSTSSSLYYELSFTIGYPNSASDTFVIEPGATYTLSYSVSASYPISFEVKIGHSVSPWTEVYSVTTDSLSSSYKTFTHQFTSTSGDTSAGLAFNAVLDLYGKLCVQQVSLTKN